MRDGNSGVGCEKARFWSAAVTAASGPAAELGRELEAERRRCGQLQQETVAAAQTAQRLEELEACLQQAQVSRCVALLQTLPHIRGFLIGNAAW